MLKLLRINNIALIPELELELGEHLTLLTGETGAGKSILIDALGLVLGDRASPDLIRSGEEKGTVEAVFESPAVAPAVTYGWGMIPAVVRIGKSEWPTALWPKDGGYIVPITAWVRKAEGVEVGDHVDVRLTVPGPRA